MQDKSTQSQDSRASNKKRRKYITKETQVVATPLIAALFAFGKR
jgi:hypothetical protein